MERINRYLAGAGALSRRGADRLIDEGAVEIRRAGSEARTRAERGTQVEEGDTVYLWGNPVEPAQEKVYLAYHKPAGVICTMRRDIRGNIADAVSYKGNVKYVGRLDKESTGLLLLTNDGILNNRLCRAAMGHEKEYICEVDKPVTEYFLDHMRNGVPILDTVTRRCKVMRMTDRSFRVILTQGLNRQIRRMCAALGYRVTKLHRVRVANIQIGDLPEGRWRYLTEQERRELFRICRMDEV